MYSIKSILKNDSSGSRNDKNGGKYSICSCLAR